MSQFEKALQAAKEYIEVPDYIENCADAVRYDFLHGPAVALIPKGDITQFTSDDLYGDSTFRSDFEEEAKPEDKVVMVFKGVVSDTLEEFISNLPSSLYYDVESGEILESEPEGETYEDDNPDYNPEDPESEEYVSVYSEPTEYFEISGKDLVRAVFGKTIANNL